MDDMATYDECDLDPTSATIIACGVCGQDDILLYPCGHIADTVTGESILIENQPLTEAGGRVLLCGVCTLHCQKLLSRHERLDVCSLRHAMKQFLNGENDAPEHLARLYDHARTAEILTQQRMMFASWTNRGHA